MHPHMRQVPNVLTVARLCALPFAVLTYVLSMPGAAWLTALIVLAAALSDVGDGLVARRWHAESEFGKWADPLVDRVFFFTLVAMLWYCTVLPWWAALPLLIRDGIIIALASPTRLYTHQGPQISRWGKAANVLLVAAVECFILDLRALGWAFLLVGGTLYVGTGLLYGGRAVAWAMRARHKGGAAA
jgi:cardiolipin synthase (CMP-forming)